AVGGAPHPVEACDAAGLEYAEHGGGATAAGHQPDVGDVMAEERCDGVLVVVPHGGDDSPGTRVGPGGSEVERIDHQACLGGIGEHRAAMHRACRVTNRRAEPCERV